MPVLDSLFNASNPSGNKLKIENFRKDISSRYKEFEGRRFTELDSLDFKIDELVECEDSTVFIALKHYGIKDEYSYILRITSYINKDKALSLEEYIPYYANGILKTAPDKAPFIDGIYALEIDLGIFSIDSLQLTPAL